MFELKAIEGSTLVEERPDGVLVYTAKATTGKDAAKREEAFTHSVWPSVAVALATVGEERLLDLATRQEKTDRMNAKRNEMNAQKSAAAIMARVMKDVAEGRCTAEQANEAFAAARAQATAEAATAGNGGDEQAA